MSLTPLLSVQGHLLHQQSSSGSMHGVLQGTLKSLVDYIYLSWAHVSSCSLVSVPTSDTTRYVTLLIHPKLGIHTLDASFPHQELSSSRNILQLFLVKILEPLLGLFYCSPLIPRSICLQRSPKHFQPVDSCFTSQVPATGVLTSILLNGTEGPPLPFPSVFAADMAGYRLVEYCHAAVERTLGR